MAESLIRVDGTSGVTRTGVKAASSLKAELGIWMSPCAKTYKRGLQREREREWKEKEEKEAREREKERKERTVNPFLSSRNEASKESLLFRETHLTFHPQADASVAVTFRFSSALSRIFAPAGICGSSDPFATFTATEIFVYADVRLTRRSSVSRDSWKNFARGRMTYLEQKK